MKIIILYFQDVKRPITGESALISKLVRGLESRGHEARILYFYNASENFNLMYDRLKRGFFSIYLLTKISKFRECDAILFYEPLYPHTQIILNFLNLLKVPLILILSYPIVNDKYYSLIIKKFPAIITGANVVEFASKVASKFKLIKPCIDTNKFKPMNIEKEWDFLYIGHLFKEKGVHQLLKAMVLLKKEDFCPTLKIIHTPCKESKFYIKYIIDKGLSNVDLEERIIKDPVEVYNKAKAFVYPGTGFHRVADTPLTVIEATACGLPVICSSLYKHIDLPNMIFFDPEPHSIKEALLTVLKQNQELMPEKLKNTLRIVREKYSIEKTAYEVEKFIEEIAKDAE